MENKRSFPAGPSGANPGAATQRYKRGPTTEEDDLIDEAMDDFDVDAAMQPPDECEDAELGEAGRNWERPAVQPFDPKTTAVGKAALDMGLALFCMLCHSWIWIFAHLLRDMAPPDSKSSSRWRWITS